MPVSHRRFAAIFIRPHWRVLLIATIGVLLQSLLALPIPLIQGRLLNQLLADGSDLGALVEQLGFAAAMTTACLGVRVILGWRVGVMMTRVSLEIVRELTGALHRKLCRLPLSFLDRHQTGGLMARLTSDVGSLMIFLNAGTLQLVSDLVLAAGIAAVLFWLNWTLALIALAVAPLAAAGHAGFAGPLRRQAEDLRSAFSELYTLLSERLPALSVVRAFNQEQTELERFTSHLDAHSTAAMRGASLSALQSAIALALGGLGTAAIVVAGAWLTVAGRLLPGDLLTFFALSSLLYAPIVRLAQFQVGWAAVRVAISRMSEILDEPDPPMGNVSIPRNKVRGSFEVRLAAYRYRRDAPAAIQEVKLRLEAGQTLGVVGPTGAGKSTLLALLANLYDAGPGCVFLDGVDVTQWKPEDLRRAVVVVPQKPTLFEGTIRSNLAYAVSGVLESRLWSVLDAVGLAEVIRNRPGGLDAVLGPGGSGLSGGQRQRLALARGILAEPAVLLLDDCTSALDPQTAAMVQANLTTLLPGVTRVIVSHKPCAVQHANEIVWLDAGQILERGTHAELIAQGGRYAALVRLTNSHLTSPPLSQHHTLAVIDQMPTPAVPASRQTNSDNAELGEAA